MDEKTSPIAAQDDKKLATYRRKIDRIKGFLKMAQKNRGPSGNERKSNITDPDSAKMSTNHGVVQGYNGVAVVDEKHQIVVTAQAHGEGQEATDDRATREQCKAAHLSNDVFQETKLTADDTMKRKFDTRFGRFIYNKRIAIVEPVFANLRNKGMDSFTLRSKPKVDAQWKMFTLVHNIEKIANYGMA